MTSHRLYKSSRYDVIVRCRKRRAHGMPRGRGRRRWTARMIVRVLSDPDERA